MHKNAINTSIDFDFKALQIFNLFKEFFASINFREFPFQEFSKTFTFAKRAKIRENRETFCSQKFVHLKYEPIFIVLK